MKVSSPISTISYNSIDFLKERLEFLCAKKMILIYCFVYHSPVDDESKGHIHVFVVPSMELDTKELNSYLCEDGVNNKMIWHKSEFNLWHTWHYDIERGCNFIGNF